MSNSKVVLPNTLVPVVISSNDGKHYMVEGDTSKTAGCLNFTHEWAINLIIRKNGTIKFSGGWEIACEDIDYKASDVDWFNHLHPGILEDLQTVLKVA